MQIKQAVSKMLITFVALLLINHVACQDVPGETGECACNAEMQELRRSVQSLSEIVQQLQSYQHQHTDKVRHCAVGMKDRRVRDRDITTNAVTGQWLHPKLGRLDNRGVPGRHLGSWGPYSHSVGAWLQVDLRTPTLITGVVTQGIGDPNPDYNDWMTSFQIAYSNNRNTDMITITDSNGDPVTFQGNRDRNTHVTNMFHPPIVARYVRLIALTWHNNVRVRLEYLTC